MRLLIRCSKNQPLVEELVSGINTFVSELGQTAVNDWVEIDHSAEAVEFNYFEQLDYDPRIIILDLDLMNAKELDALYKKLQSSDQENRPFCVIISTKPQFGAFFSNHLPTATFLDLQQQSVPYQNIDAVFPAVKIKIVAEPNASNAIPSTTEIAGHKNFLGKLTQFIGKKKKSDVDLTSSTESTPQHIDNQESSDEDNLSDSEMESSLLDNLIDDNAPPLVSLESLWTIRMNGQIHIDQVFFKDDGDFEESWDLFQLKVFDPFISSLANEITHSITTDENRYSNNLPVLVDCSNAVVNHLVAQVLKVKKQRFTFDRNSLAPPLFQSLSIPPDLLLMNRFEDLKFHNFLAEELKLLENFEELNYVDASEEEINNLMNKYFQRRRILLNSLKEQNQKKISQGIIGQSKKILIESEQSLEFLEKSLEMASFMEQVKPINLEKNRLTLIMSFDEAKAKEFIIQISHKVKFVWLNLDEFSEWERLSSFQSISYGNPNNYDIVIDKASSVRLRSLLNRFYKEIEIERVKIAQDETNKGNKDQEISLSEEHQSALLNLFSACLIKSLNDAYSNLRSILLANQDRQRHHRLVNKSLPVLIFTEEEEIGTTLKASMDGILAKLSSGSKSLIDLVVRVQDNTLDSSDADETALEEQVIKWIDTIISFLAEPVNRRAVILHTDVNIVIHIMKTLFTEIDPYLPVIPIVQGEIEQTHLNFFRSHGCPMIYHSYSLEKRPNEIRQLIHAATQKYIPII